MKFNRVSSNRTPIWVYGSFLLIALMSHATAANQTPYRPENTQKPGFFQRTSDSIGGFFHRVFNPDDAPPPPQPQRRPSGQRGKTKSPSGPRYNLDEPPSGVAPATPKSSQAPLPSNNKTTAAPTKSSTTKRPTVSIEEPKTTKTKPVNNNTNSEKKEVVVKPTTPEKKPAPEHKPPQPTTENTGTENTTTQKAPQEQSVLTGSKTSKAGRVKSPYPPYNELDVSGLSAGSLALDPTTQKVFRVP